MNQTEAADPTDPVDHNHSHTQIVSRIPQYAQVLELGCATGEMSRMMKRNCQAQVFGVEKDPQSAWQAQRHCDYVFTEDLDDAESLSALQFEKFDVITLVDVIEHLQRPEALLERLKPLMMAESTILLSVPNVAHASVRLELLTGDFSYEDAGILDSTHLKFFTLKSLKSMLARCGFVINEIDYTWHDIPDSVISRYLRQVGIEATPHILDYFHQPEAIAYQFIVSVSLPKISPEKNRDDSEGEDKMMPSMDHNLKPMAASWQTWGQVFGNLQQKEQIIHGLELQMESCREEMARLNEDVKLKSEELDRVYATRSWQMLRRVAGIWRGGKNGVQGGLTHH
ncbi:MAG: Methyltransferase domain-containing protein [uncultured Thiotrichaceae bacterium]|uniref:Methyltransferase domain-containing protein n=1 Tax=uncultured Thiotrichaceae bacterium TaxID=298394 RepID=A0A6S6T5H0_9GAMM|nr:MAG: Methyltransferase domain-containing protein [uncultured Thiotrichaceae bacterium]